MYQDKKSGAFKEAIDLSFKPAKYLKFPATNLQGVGLLTPE
jgi:hypothetical protein